MFSTYGIRLCVILSTYLVILPILGDSVLSGQSNNGTVHSEVNTTLIPDRYSNIVAEFFMSENVTVVDGLVNISTNDLCSSAATPVIEILTTFTSLEVSCSDCG